MTVYDGELWNSCIHCCNATFDLLDKFYNFLLNASVPTLLGNKEIKRKFGLHVCFLFLKNLVHVIAKFRGILWKR